MRLCRLCNERHVCPSRLRHHDYRCSRCRNRAPSQQAAARRYGQTPAKRADNDKRNPRRIFIGTRYHSAAKTPELAAAVNAKIKERVLGFKQGQPTGTPAQGD